jgi:glyoxalase family protein
VRLDGIHHITAITANAPGNVDFYARALGLRLVKKTVNFDAPDVYHLYYGDERGTPGSVLTFFEFPDAARGRHGAGMIHTVVWRVGAADALDFWERRLEAEGIEAERSAETLRFADPEGLGIELVTSGVPDRPLAAAAGDIPVEHALLGFDGVRAYTRDEAASKGLLLEALSFTSAGHGAYEVAGDRRRASYVYEPSPPEPGLQGAGTVHHVAWACEDDEEQAAWRARVAKAGAHPTPPIDRTYFHSIYFREPSGVLFELATRGPGFDVDEPAESLGESLKLPERYEPMRERLEATLTPLHNPRQGAPAS